MVFGVLHKQLEALATTRSVLWAVVAESGMTAELGISKGVQQCAAANRLRLNVARARAGGAKDLARASRQDPFLDFAIHMFVASTGECVRACEVRCGKGIIMA